MIPYKNDSLERGHKTKGFKENLLGLIMDFCLVPSLQHLSCSKIVISLLNKLLPFFDISCLIQSDGSQARPFSKRYRDDYSTIRRQVAKDIKNLIPIASLQKKLKSFIAPLFFEIETWINNCSFIWTGNDGALSVIMQNIPQCWSTDGVIDREKSAKSVIKSSNVLLTTRFIFACYYCVYEDILGLWKLLSQAEKNYLREEYAPHRNPREQCTGFDVVVKLWVEWLESRLNKDWQYCVAWILGTSLWDMNAYVLRRVLLALTPLERRHYLLKALISPNSLRTDIAAIRFCLSLMTREEREVVCRDSPLQVIRCMTSWPLRTNSLTIEDRLWSYLTANTFCDILDILLEQLLRLTRGDSTELILFLKSFWRKSPYNFRSVAKDRDSIFSDPLQFVLDYDFTKKFSRMRFMDCFTEMSARRYRPKDLTIGDNDSSFDSDSSSQSVRPSNRRSSLQCCVIL